jgi:nephron
LQVTIAGPSEARHGDIVNFQCITAPSNPQAEIRWTIDGRQRRANSTKSEVSNEGGSITSSNITLAVESSKRSITVLCQGINPQLADNIMTSHTLHILCKGFLFSFNLYIFLHVYLNSINCK